MAIYAVQGLYAAGCLYMTYDLCRNGLNPFFTNPEGVTTGKIKEFVDSQARKMDLGKEIVVIPDLNKESRLYYSSYGNTWLPGKVAIKVGYGVTENSEVRFSEFQTTHYIAHLKANDWLILPLATLAASLFTTYVLTVNRDLFTRYLGGLVIGLMTSAVLLRRAERRADQEAMEQCSIEVNKAHLDMRENQKKKGCRQNPLKWIFNPSLDERIEHLKTYLQSQKEVSEKNLL